MQRCRDAEDVPGRGTLQRETFSEASIVIRRVSIEFSFECCASRGPRELDAGHVPVGTMYVQDTHSLARPSPE